MLEILERLLGVNYNCETLNSFNLLTKDVRKEWRAAGVSELGSGGVGCGGDDGEGC